MAPNKDLQATLELINNYKHTAEQKKGTNQGVSLTPVNKGKVPWQSRYYYDISKRMYAEPELFIVFKDTNCTEGNRLLCFSQRLWIYATGNFVRLMNSTSLRSVFRQHTNSVTDIHIIENNPSHHFLLCTADKNGTVCIWSISQKTNAAPVGLPHYIHNFNHRVVKVESMLNPHSKSAFFLFVVLETSGVHIFEFPRSMSRNEIDGAELDGSSSIALPFPPTGAHVISQSSSGACALHLNKILLLSQGALLRAFLLPDVRSQNVWKSLYEVQVETRDPRTAQSRTDSITFLHSLNATTCLIATLTSLQIRKIPSSVELSAHDSKNLGKLIHTLFLDDLSHYTIQLHSLKEKQFAVVACSTQLEPLLCVHIGPMMPETNADEEETTFCFTHVSEYELLSGVHSFQIVNGREPNTIGVYLMHANYIVQMILQSPHGVTPQRVQSIENSEMNAERFIEQSQGANVRNQLISKNDQRIQVVEGTSVTRKSTDSEKSDEKIAKLMENFMIQKQQIQSLTEIIEMQSKIVNEMSQKAEGALGEKSGDRHAVGKDKRSVHTAQDDALASLEKRVLQLRKQIQDFEQSENHKVRLLMDEFIRVLSHRVPNLINDALSKVIQKEINKSRTSQTNVAKDVLSTCQSSIEKLLCDVQSEVATHFDKQNNTMIEEILDWKGTLLSELDRVYAELSALSTLRRSEWGE